MMSHLSVVDDQLEEGVHQQDTIWQDAAAVQQHRLKTFKREKTSAAGNTRRGARLRRLSMTLTDRWWV